MGKKQYELTNHLGNVLAVVNDTRTGVDSDANGSFNYYEPDVLASNEYYPFGMNMPGSRSYALGGATAYRYGFNGKEKDPKTEWGGLNQYDYGFRIYNPTIGRFLSVDPLTRSYPMLTPYQFASNTPIQAIDLDGLEARIANSIDENNRPVVTIILDVDIIDMSDNCEQGFGKECLVNTIFRKDVLHDVEEKLSSNTTANADLETIYKFQFGEISIYEKGEANNATRPFKITLGSVDQSQLERDYLEVDLGQAKVGETQNNTVIVDLSSILSNSSNIRYEFTSVLAHEIGHSMGLQHATNEGGPADSEFTVDKNIPFSDLNVMRTNGNYGILLNDKQFEKMAKTVEEQQPPEARVKKQ